MSLIKPISEIHQRLKNQLRNACSTLGSFLFHPTMKVRSHSNHYSFSLINTFHVYKYRQTWVFLSSKKQMGYTQGCCATSSTGDISNG